MPAEKTRLLHPNDHLRIHKALEAMAVQATILAKVLTEAYGTNVGDKAHAVHRDTRRLMGIIDTRFYAQSHSTTAGLTPLPMSAYQGEGEKPTAPASPHIPPVPEPSQPLLKGSM